MKFVCKIMKSALIMGLVLSSIVGSLNVSAQDSETDAETGASEVTADFTHPDDLAESYDVIVIGAGGGGMAAAIAAKDAGSNVAIFEKMPILGGNTLKSSAGMNASESKFQEAEGIEDSNELFFEETMAGGHDTNDEELVHYLVDNSASAIEWLDSMGINLSSITTTGGMSVPRAHRPEDGSAIGGYLVDGLQRNVFEREIPTFVNANVTEILEEDGVVTGVQVNIEGNEHQVNAKAVIIATGGFGGNLEMVTDNNPDLEGFVTTNHEGATGDGLVMAQEVGAQLVDMDQIQIHPTVEQETSYLITEAVRGEGAILVNKEGERFFNELDTRDAVSQAILSQTDSSAYVIFDQALRGRVKAIDQYESMGLVKVGDTIEELATTIELDPEVLSQTLSIWNDSVANGTDDNFGRTTGMEIALEEAPFYAIKIAPGIHHTMGGVKINTNAQVLNEADEAITGLYAAGEASGGVHGSNRIGGNAIADIIIFGRQAGEQSALFVN